MESTVRSTFHVAIFCQSATPLGVCEVANKAFVVDQPLHGDPVSKRRLSDPLEPLAAVN